MLAISFRYGAIGQSERIMIPGTLWFRSSLRQIPIILLHSLLGGLVCGVPGWVTQAEVRATYLLLAKKKAGCLLVLQIFISLRRERWSSYSSPYFSIISPVWPAFSVRRVDSSLGNTLWKNFSKSWLATACSAGTFHVGAIAGRLQFLTWALFRLRERRSRRWGG